MGMIGTREAAKALNVSPRRVVQLIKAKRLAARQIGGTYVIDSTDLATVRNRPAGRPPSNRSKPVKTRRATGSS